MTGSLQGDMYTLVSRHVAAGRHETKASWLVVSPPCQTKTVNARGFEPVPASGFWPILAVSLSMTSAYGCICSDLVCTKRPIQVPVGLDSRISNSMFHRPKRRLQDISL